MKGICKPEESTRGRAQGVGGTVGESVDAWDRPRRDSWSMLRAPCNVLNKRSKELESMIKKVVQDQDAKHVEIRSSACGLIQTKRGETDPAVCETAQFTVKPRLSAL